MIKGVPYRIYSGYANSVYSLCVLGDRIGSLRDFTPDDKIAIPSFGGTNHLKLARLAAEQLGSPSALNPMLVEMAQPDAIQALTTGGVAGTFMSFPNNYAQQACEGVRVLYESAFDEVTTELLTVATKDLHDNHRALYDAVAAATRDAVGYICENPDEVAGILAEEYKVDPAKMRGWLAALNFHTVPVGVEDTLKLMIELDLLGEVPEPLPELYYEGVMAGEP